MYPQKQSFVLNDCKPLGKKSAVCQTYWILGLGKNSYLCIFWLICAVCGTYLGILIWIKK